MKDRTRSYRTLVPTFLALIKPTFRRPCFTIPALGAAKPSRPTKRRNISQAVIVADKSLSKFNQCFWIVLHSHILHIVAGGVKCIPPLRYNWAARKGDILNSLNDGTYQFDTVRELLIDGRIYEVWTAADAVEIKTLTISLKESKILENCSSFHLEGKDGVKAAVGKVRRNLKKALIY